jgi:hypothetical protein
MSENKKAIEFKNRNKKLAAINEADQASQIKDINASIHQLLAAFVGLNKRIVDVEKSNRIMYPAALDGEFRSHAIAKILAGLNIGVTEKAVEQAMKDMYAEEFEAGDPGDDLLKNLEPAAEGATAVDGMFAVLNLKMFKGGKELPAGEVVRRKIELGKQEVFPELDALVVGMKVGEAKRVPFVIGNDSDEMEISLLKLRQKKVTKEVANESIPQERSGFSQVIPDPSGEKV